jgi:glucoamylase
MNILNKLTVFLSIYLVNNAICFICPNVGQNDQYYLDCGYVGITQTECINKGCCWQPTLDHSAYCTYSQIISNNNYYKPIDGSTLEFTSNEINKFFNYFISNMDINKTGAVAAAPDLHTPGGSYFYHWSRDGALTMDSLQSYSNTSFALPYLNDYKKWLLNIQSKSDPNNIDIRIEPKFEIPSGDAYTGGWCRPQNDGVGLQAITLINSENIKFTGSSEIWNQIKYNLDYIIDGYDDSTCDLWEEITSTDFFWNRVTMAKALSLGSEYAKKTSHFTDANTWLQMSNYIKSGLFNTHWNGYYYYESNNRPIDGAVIVGLNDGYDEIDNFLNPLSYEVASTIYYYNLLFSEEYAINNKDQKIGGILYGRYSGDVYAGGNPWILTTASLSSLFYRISHLIKTNNMEKNTVQMWSKAFNKDINNLSNTMLSDFFRQQGDTVLNRIKYYIESYDFHMYEQIDKNTGQQLSAYDLTWSYAEVLNALNLRSKI